MKKYVCWSVPMIACLLAIFFLAAPGNAKAEYPDVTIPGFLPEFGQRSSYTIPLDINPHNVSVSEVQFILTNGPALSSILTWTNETMDRPDVPFDSGYVITDWYTSPAFDEDSKWNFNDDLVIQTNMVLFAERVVRTTPVMSAPFQLPVSTKIIEENAFEGSQMTIVYIPEGCELIGKYAFKNCVNLQQVMISGRCNIGENAFNGCQSVLIIAPAGSPAEEYCSSHVNCTFVRLNTSN